MGSCVSIRACAARDAGRDLASSVSPFGRRSAEAPEARVCERSVELLPVERSSIDIGGIRLGEWPSSAVAYLVLSWERKVSCHGCSGQLEQPDRQAHSRVTGR
jgi:hypothetical protein